MSHHNPTRSFTTLLVTLAALAVAPATAQLTDTSPQRPATIASADAPSTLPPAFELVVVDLGGAGDCKMVGDIDGDTLPDAVVGGMPGEGLVWYRWPDWRKTTIAIPNTEFTTDGRLGDIDGDGDLDVVVPDGPSGNNLLWFENPLPAGNPLSATWARHTVGSLGSWGKDVHVSDYDGDGSLDIGTRTETAVYMFFGNGGSSWTMRTIRTGLSGEGMTSGDVDGDGDDDLVCAGFWLENPEPAGNARTQPWTASTIVPLSYATVKALVTDLDSDGIHEVLFSDSEGTGDVLRCEPAAGDPHGAWTINVIVPNLNRCHTLQAADVDLDGDMDVVLGQMHTSTARELAVYLNNDGSATSWTKDVVDNTGVHNAVVADFGSDGVPDIFGCNWTGNPPVRFWHNETVPVNCPSDLTTANASAGDPGYGVPDGMITQADLSFFVNAWFTGDVTIADVTTLGAGAGDPGYGVPEGQISQSDLNYFVNLWVAGCP